MPTPKKRLPFKRTVARKKTPEHLADEPGANKPKDSDDRDEDIQFFRRHQDAFSYFEDLEPSKGKEPRSPPRAPIAEKETQGYKRRKVSLDSTGDQDSGFIGSGRSRRQARVYSHLQGVELTLVGTGCRLHDRSSRNNHHPRRTSAAATTTTSSWM